MGPQSDATILAIANITNSSSEETGKYIVIEHLIVLSLFSKHIQPLRPIELHIL